jgi:hypothetical protein
MLAGKLLLHPRVMFSEAGFGSTLWGGLLYHPVRRTPKDAIEYFLVVVYKLYLPSCPPIPIIELFGNTLDVPSDETRAHSDHSEGQTRGL